MRTLSFPCFSLPLSHSRAIPAVRSGDVLPVTPGRASDQHCQEALSHGLLHALPRSVRPTGPLCPRRSPSRLFDPHTLPPLYRSIFTPSEREGHYKAQRGVSIAGTIVATFMAFSWRLLPRFRRVPAVGYFWISALAPPPPQ